MKEFLKKMKAVSKRNAPDKEFIRCATKGEWVVTSSKVERHFSVGSLAAIAVIFMLVTVIVVGSVLVEQTRKPVGSDVGSNSDTETTDTMPQDTDSIDLNNVYPLNYQTTANIPLWEGRTPEEELTERLNRKEIVFADSELSFKKSEAIEGVIWETSDFDNVTTEELYDTCSCELIWIRGNIFVLDGNTLHLATDRAFAERDGDKLPVFSWEAGLQLASVYYVPCSVGEKGGIMIHYSVDSFTNALGFYEIRTIIFYDLAKHSVVRLFVSSAPLIGEAHTNNYQFILDLDLAVDLPKPQISLRWVAIEKREENVDSVSYRILAVNGKEEQYYPYPLVVTEVYGYTPVGNLYYDGKRDVWSFDAVNTPNQSTESETEPSDTEPPEAETTAPPETLPPLPPELDAEFCEQLVDVGNCSDPAGMQALWDFSYVSPDESVYPVYWFRQASELQTFYEKTKSYLHYDWHISSPESFSDLVADHYRDDFFESKSLLVLYVPLRCQSYEIWSSVEVSQEGWIHLTVRRREGFSDLVMWGRLIVLEVGSTLDWLKGITVEDVSMDPHIPSLSPGDPDWERLQIFEDKTISDIRVSNRSDESERLFWTVNKINELKKLLGNMTLIPLDGSEGSIAGTAITVEVSYCDGTITTFHLASEPYIVLENHAVFEVLEQKVYGDLCEYLLETPSDKQEGGPEDLVVKAIYLTYCGNTRITHVIEDSEIMEVLLGYMTNADGIRGESTRGMYGCPFTLTIRTSDGQLQTFYLWGAESYATSSHLDEEGYSYLYYADMSAMYEYLGKRYPKEFWYPS